MTFYVALTHLLGNNLTFQTRGSQRCRLTPFACYMMKVQMSPQRFLLIKLSKLLLWQNEASFIFYHGHMLFIVAESNFIIIHKFSYYLACQTVFVGRLMD